MVRADLVYERRIFNSSWLNNERSNYQKRPEEQADDARCLMPSALQHGYRRESSTEKALLHRVSSPTKSRRPFLGSTIIRTSNGRCSITLGYHLPSNGTRVNRDPGFWPMLASREGMSAQHHKTSPPLRTACLPNNNHPWPTKSTTVT